MTLSIVKNGKDTDGTQKLYYNENVYRVSKNSGAFKEIQQTGVECIGDVGNDEILDVLTLALNSLKAMGPGALLEISHVGILEEIMDFMSIPATLRSQMLTCIGEKNAHELLRLGANEAFCRLVTSSGDSEAIAKLLAPFYPNGFSENVNTLLCTCRGLKDTGFIRIDFSILNDLNYYNGIVFHGFVSGTAHSVLSGGQYDRLMKKLGRRSGAIGFAVYLDLLGENDAPDDIRERPEDWLNIALPKGRLGEKVYGLLETAGFPCPSIREENRKLIFENTELKIRYFWSSPLMLLFMWSEVQQILAYAARISCLNIPPTSMSCWIWGLANVGWQSQQKRILPTTHHALCVSPPNSPASHKTITIPWDGILILYT